MESWCGGDVLDEQFLEFVVQDKHQSSSGTSEHVGEGSLEEGAGSWGTEEGRRGTVRTSGKVGGKTRYLHN